jgi:hypothetical protein
MDDIIKCPNCGTNNRVGGYESNLRPICGRCRSPLEKAIEAFREKTPSSAQKTFLQYNYSEKTKIIIGIVLSFFFICIAFIIYQIKQPNQTSLPEQTQIRQPDQSQLLRRSATEQPKEVVPIQPPSKENRRLANGTIIYQSNINGLGKLTVKNGLITDAVAKLIDAQKGRCKAFFYISSGNQFTFTNIDDGRYRLFFGTGVDWDQNNKFFRYNKSFSEFEKLMIFETIEESNQFSVKTNYTVMEVTLHPVFQGNIRTNTISEEEFKKY